MSRDLTTAFVDAVTGDAVAVGFLFSATFADQTQYVWSGPGNLSYLGQTWRGVGSLGKIDAIVEGIDVNADGTSVGLSGIDAALLAETLGEVQIGAPASLIFALFDASLNVIAAYPVFTGTVDQPVLSPGLETFDIALKLENRLANLQRANMRRYTAADQNLYYPDDTAFNWVESLNDQALRWG